MTKRALRVAVLAERLGTSAGGVEVYERCLLNSLFEESRNSSLELVPILARETGLDSLHPELRPYCRVLRPTGKLGTILSFWLEIKRCQPDLMHACFVIPPLLNEDIPVISTVHDIGFIAFPEHYTYLQRLKLNIALDRILRRSFKVVTVSENTRGDLIDHFGTDSNRVVTVYNGLDSNFIHHHSGENDKDILFKYGISKPYILYTGKLEPRKNVIPLIRAYNRLRKSERFSGQLVILGSPKTFLFEQAQRSIDDSPYRESIVQTGYVAAENVPIFYANGQVLCFPSLYEGFGFPVLEAMASGIPVVCSRSTCLPEIVGDAGLLVDPEDDVGMADRLAEVIHDVGLRDTLIGKGLERACFFNWKTSAQKMIDLYHETSRSGSRG